MISTGKRGPVIRLEDVHLYFGARKVLQGVNMTFEPGRNNVVIGPSGSGKSTILRLVSGLLKPTRGRIWVDDQDITTFGRDVATVSTLFFRDDAPGQCGRQMQTWLRTEAGWRIVAAHVSLIADPRQAG